MALGNGGRSRIVLSAKEGQHGVDLMLVSRPELAIADEAAVTPLLTGASTIDFSYFGSPRSGEGAQWHAQWSDATTLPRLIRVRVAFPHILANGKRDWPDLVIATRIGADVGCVLDQLTSQCRGR